MGACSLSSKAGDVIREICGLRKPSLFRSWHVTVTPYMFEYLGDYVVQEIEAKPAAINSTRRAEVTLHRDSGGSLAPVRPFCSGC